MTKRAGKLSQGGSVLLAILLIVGGAVLSSAAFAVPPGGLEQNGGNGDGGGPNDPNSGSGEPYTVTIWGPATIQDGMPATFRAMTNPPGFEDEVSWSAITKFGGAYPSDGTGAQFTVVFHDTFGGPGRRCRWLAVRADDAEFQQVGEDDCIQDLLVPKGEDCWKSTDCDTQASFCIDPIPQDFFDPGSEAWKGRIDLKGPDGNEPDTRLTRKQDMFFPGWDIRQTPIALTTLDLEGCDVITVEMADGSEVAWEVRVEESEAPPEEDGTLLVSRHYDNGGVFAARFPVHVKYVFTKVGDPEEVRELDTGLEGLDPLELQTVAQPTWVAELEPQIPDDFCGTNFKPGVRGFLGGGPTSQCCCVPTGHSSGKPGHLHKTGERPFPCPEGACFDPSTLTCTEVLEGNCPYIFKGESTLCYDSDGDGIPDWFERNDCCAQGTLLPGETWTDPFNPDTDGDGLSDGEELRDQVTDPCTPDNPNP